MAQETEFVQPPKHAPPGPAPRKAHRHAASSESPAGPLKRTSQIRPVLASVLGLLSIPLGLIGTRVASGMVTSHRAPGEFPALWAMMVSFLLIHAVFLHSFANRGRVQVWWGMFTGITLAVGGALFRMSSWPSRDFADWCGFFESSGGMILFFAWCAFAFGDHPDA